MARPLFRIAGLPIAIDWSVIMIATLLAWGLADSVLPESAPGHQPAMYWLAGTVGALLLLASVPAHELAHALVARRSGIEVEGLTLWVFGGIASLRGTPRTPGADFRIAAVGPATSVAVGICFGALAVLLDAADAGGLAIGVASWLAGVNVVLALFNLVPGAPLDGGRVLRAALWRHWGDQVRAGIAATTAGQAVAAGLVVLAALSFLAGDTVGAFWLVLIGWFVHSAAAAERDSIVAQAALSGVSVGTVMSTDVQTAPASVRVADFIDSYLLAGHHSGYPVVEHDGSVDGLVTLAQLRGAPATWRQSALVRDVCLPLDKIAVTSPDEPLVTLLPRLTREAGARALVFEHDRLVGILTPADVSRAIAARQVANSRQAPATRSS